MARRLPRRPALGDAVLALIMLLIILFRPNGIAGGKEIGAWLVPGEPLSSPTINTGSRNRSIRANPSRGVPRGSLERAQSRWSSAVFPAFRSAVTRRPRSSHIAAHCSRESLARRRCRGRERRSSAPSLRVRQGSPSSVPHRDRRRRRKPRKNRKDALFGEVPDEEDFFVRQPDHSGRRACGQDPNC